MKGAVEEQEVVAWWLDMCECEEHCERCSEFICVPEMAGGRCRR